MGCSTNREQDGRYTINCSSRTFYAIGEFNRLPKPMQMRVLRLIQSLASEYDTKFATVLTFRPKR